MTLILGPRGVGTSAARASADSARPQQAGAREALKAPGSDSREMIGKVAPVTQYYSHCCTTTSESFSDVHACPGHLHLFGPGLSVIFLVATVRGLDYLRRGRLLQPGPHAQQTADNSADSEHRNDDPEQGRHGPSVDPGAQIGERMVRFAG